MNTKGKNYTQNFMAHAPTELDNIINSRGQDVIFYEHPTNGDEDTIYCMIDHVLANTEFFDLEDMIAGSDYEPILQDGQIHCNFELDQE